MIVKRLLESWLLSFTELKEIMGKIRLEGQHEHKCLVVDIRYLEYPVE